MRQSGFSGEWARARTSNACWKLPLSASARADARVRQNLGLVVGLQGRFAEAEAIVKADLPAAEAAANVAYLKQMLSRKDNPRAGAARVPVASLNRPD